MVVYLAIFPAFVPDVPYLHIVRLAGLGSTKPRTTIRAKTDRKPRPVPFKPPFTIRLYLPRSIIKLRSNSPQTRSNAVLHACLPARVNTQQKRIPIRYPLPALLCIRITSIRRYLTPILSLSASYLSSTPLT